MRRITLKLITPAVLILILNLACSQSQELPQQTEWLIPQSNVFDGGPGKDGIPSVDSPTFITTNDVNYMQEDDLVLSIKVNDKVRAYTHPVLDWHEIVNDEIDDLSFALTYCPLTGTGIGWNREIDGEKTTFGVSGKLFNTNLMPYDRKTDSYWSQMRFDCVNGSLVGTKVENITFFETTWKTWKMFYPDSEVIGTNTGHSRNYGQYPYGDYKTNHNLLIFPVSNEDSRLNRKERVLSVYVNDKVKAYGFKDFVGPQNTLIEDNINSRDVLIVGNAELNFITSFYKEDGRTYNPVQNEFPTILEDDLGNKYDIFGHNIDEANSSQSLSQPTSMIAYWFALAAFYPDVELY